jgi:HEAT repeat protein
MVGLKVFNINQESLIEQIIDDLVLFDPSKSMGKDKHFLDVTDENELHELVEAAKKRNFKVKYFVIRHLENFGYDSVIVDLLSFLSDENHIIRNTAQHALDKIKSEKNMISCLI